MRSPLIAAIVLVLATGIAAAQPPLRDDATLTVHGRGRARVPPDHATLTVAAVTKGASFDAATSAHRERASRAVSALRDMKNDGLEIEQSSFSLSELRSPSPPGASQGQGKSEYQAATTFELKMTRVDAVDRTVTAIAATGLFEVRNLRFGIEDRNPGLDAALKNAVEDAQARAALYAQAAGIQLGGILSIEDSDARNPREFALLAPVARNVQVIPPETLTLSASVTITWRIEP